MQSRFAPEFIEEICGVVKSLSHPVRMHILEILAQGESTVGALSETCEVSQPVMSQHLRILRDKRLLATRRDGNRIYYRISDPIATRILDCMTKTQEERERAL